MDHSDWKHPRLARALFAAPRPPSAFETEAFVSRVMARLRTEAALPSTLRWLLRPWAAPALGLGLAAVLVAASFSGPFQASAEEPAAEWVLPEDDAP